MSSQWVTPKEQYPLFHDSSTYGNQHMMYRPIEERSNVTHCQGNQRGASDAVYSRTQIDAKLEAALKHGC